MRIVRREVSRWRVLLHGFIIIMIGGYLTEHYIHGDPMLEMFGVLLIAQGLSGVWLNYGEKSTMMRCLERGPDADTIKKSNLDYIMGYEVGYAKGRNSQYMLDKSATGQAVLDTSPKE